MTKILIILIGNELVTGDIYDTNAKYLLQKIKGTSLEPIKIITIPDDKTTIVDCLKEHLGKVDLIITSGGLGPTTDDITIECVASALNLPIELNEESLSRLKAKYESRGRPVLENSLKQTKFPKGALVFPNEVGTADASCSGPVNSTYIISLPGVPKEFKFFIDKPVLEWLNEKYKPNTNTHYKYFRVFGLSEAYVGNTIENSKLDPKVEALYRPHFPELLLYFRSSSPELLEKESNIALNAIGKDHVYSSKEDDSLPLVVSNLLREKGETLSIAESCTGGLLGSLITAIPGASEVFLGSAVTYTNDLKSKFLSIPSGLINRVGAVSPEVASQMARAIRIKTGSSIGLAATGIAGPKADNSTKQVGLIYLSLSTNSKEHVTKLELPWDREMNQRYACHRLLDMLRRELLNLEIDIKSY